MRTALVYDRVNKWGGAERVLLALNEIFPDAPLYTLVYSPDKAKWAKKFPKVIPSFLNKIPIIRHKHELLATFAPIGFEAFDFSQYDLVISITSEAAKGVIVRPPTRHLCYMLTPTRYLWSGFEKYRQQPQRPLNMIPFYKQISLPFINYLRYWDRIAANRPDKLIAISKEVQNRIKKYYNRDSIVIYPPVDTDIFSIKKKGKGNHYLIVSRLVPYKRIDLVIRAFNKLGRELVIVGIGSEQERLKRMAKDNIKFLGYISDKELTKVYCQAIAFIHPQDEDFGIAAVEAQAAGVPVIAYKKGGAQESVIDGVTGIFFNQPTLDSLVTAVKRFDRMDFTRKTIIDNARRFSKARFKNEFIKIINNV